MDGADMPSAGRGLVPRASVFQLEAARNAAIEDFGEAFDKLQAAHRSLNMAAPTGASGNLPSLQGGRHDYADLSTREKYLEFVTKGVDRSVWSHLIASTGLDRLMDRAERDAFRDALEKDPPPATAENCFATMERLMGDADLIFKRGIATAFSRLDRRFRSHDGFKVGARMVLSNAFSDGHWNHYSKHDETLIDVERTFCQLDGKPQPERLGGIVGVVDAERPRGWGNSAFRVENDYFDVRVFGNGNAHLWFKRKDLVLKVNQLLADYYGAAVGASPDVADVKHAYASTPATSGGGFGLFPTPEAVALKVLEEAGAQLASGYVHRQPETYTVLEPSAGTGNLARPALAPWAKVTCVEVQGRLAAQLATEGFARVVHGDFLEQDPAHLGLFDKILMNPPFDQCRDLDHVTHALNFLKPGGVLVSVMGAGVEFREDRKTADFRAEVERRGGHFRDLPPASFAESGTYMNTVLCVIGRRR